MRDTVLILALACVAHAWAEVLSAASKGYAQDSIDQIDKLIDKLVDKLIGKLDNETTAWFLRQDELNNTTLALRSHGRPPLPAHSYHPSHVRPFHPPGIVASSPRLVLSRHAGLPPSTALIRRATSNGQTSEEAKTDIQLQVKEESGLAEKEVQSGRLADRVIDVALIFGFLGGVVLALPFTLFTEAKAAWEQNVFQNRTAATGAAIAAVGIWLATAYTQFGVADQIIDPYTQNLKVPDIVRSVRLELPQEITDKVQPLSLSLKAPPIPDFRPPSLQLPESINKQLNEAQRIVTDNVKPPSIPIPEAPNIPLPSVKPPNIELPVPINAGLNDAQRELSTAEKAVSSRVQSLSRKASDITNIDANTGLLRGFINEKVESLSRQAAKIKPPSLPEEVDIQINLKSPGFRITEPQSPPAAADLQPTPPGPTFQKMKPAAPAQSSAYKPGKPFPKP